MRDTLEIERRYLADPGALPPLPPGTPMEQSYLGFDPVVRVRLQGERAFLTVKGPGLVARREVELEIPVPAARALAELRVEGTAVIRKTRHELPHGGRTWEVDVYLPPLDGLVLVEVELGAADEAPEPPPWAGPEVTEDPRYTNAALARLGTPSVPTAP
ncbi:MAG: CYTH domain-containing protein [Deferrisomatales bacterium]|nr:CYTH domain-containing protein [Deferrisomatales bacterium]